MRKAITVMIVTIVMVASLFMPGNAALLNADAENVPDVSKSIEAVKISVSELGDIISIPEGQQDAINHIFDDFSGAFKTMGGLVGPINGAINFLKLIGVMKDSKIQQHQL